MEGKMVDLVEDIGLGITQEQLVPKPITEEEKDHGNQRTNRTKNRK